MRRVCRLLAPLVLTVLAIPVTGCGLVSTESTRIITIDSLTVSASTTPGDFRVRAHGMRGIGGCDRALEVFRATRGDSVVRRFVSILDGSREVACPAAPFPLDFEEIVTVAPDRTLHYVVQQPDGTRLVRAIPSQ